MAGVGGAAGGEGARTDAPGTPLPTVDSDLQSRREYPTLERLVHPGRGLRAGPGLGVAGGGLGAGSAGHSRAHTFRPCCALPSCRPETLARAGWAEGPGAVGEGCVGAHADPGEGGLLGGQLPSEHFTCLWLSQVGIPAERSPPPCGSQPTSPPGLCTLSTPHLNSWVHRPLRALTWRVNKFLAVWGCPRAPVLQPHVAGLCHLCLVPSPEPGLETRS